MLSVRSCMLGGLLCIFLLVGCQAPRIENPYAVMLDKEADWSLRRQAADQAFLENKNESAFTDTLHKIVWSPGYPPWQRKQAVDMLIRIDEQAFRDALIAKIMAVPDRETLAHIYDYAVNNNWRDFTPLAVRCYARPDPRVPDKIRPERQVIRALNPDRKIEDVIFEVFVKDADKSTLPKHVAAWDLLFRLTSKQHVAGLLQNAPQTALVKDIKKAYHELGVIPSNREEVAWLFYLLDPAREQWWNEARRLVNTLTADRKRDLSLRHLPVLMHAHRALLARSRSVLLAEIAVQMGQLPHHAKNPDLLPLQTISRNAQQLSWGDLIVIYSLMDALESKEVTKSLFAQADLDLEDKTTERGGVIVAGDAERTYIMKPFVPHLKRGDDVFIPPESMVQTAYTGLFYYHFHAQKHENTEHAGPGAGDRDVANRLPFNHVVLTFIDNGQLNVDIYFANNVVIDVGTIRR